MAVSQFTGTGVAIVTPFRNDESVDFPSLEKLIGHLLAGGVNYLVVMGTTGESVTLNRDERHALLEFVKETAGGKIPVVVGIGGNNTQAVVSKIRDTDLNGVAGILSVAPYYNKPGQKGLYQHFKTIASASPVPVILYNVPGRTCSNLAADTVVQLATDIKNIVAVKEASGNFSQIMEIIRKAPPVFRSYLVMTALPCPSSPWEVPG